jgi:hypothetical protein
MLDDVDDAMGLLFGKEIQTRGKEILSVGDPGLIYFGLVHAQPLVGLFWSLVRFQCRVQSLPLGTCRDNQP